jgi:YbbR domain-containing protein
VTTPVTIPLPEGVSTTSEASATVTVDIVPSSGSARLTVAPELLNVEEGLTATVDAQALVIVVQGPIPALDQLAPADVRAVIDLAGRVPGTYDEVPQVEVPEGLTVVSVTPQTVSVTLSQ